MTRITGAEGRIADYTYEELQQLDVGNWFSADFAGTRIPTLQEMLAHLKDSDVKIYLELKNIGDVEGFEEKVLEIVQEYGMTERCVFASFYYPYLTALKELDPNVEILYNTTSSKITMTEEFPAEYYGLYIENVKADLVEKIHSVGASVFVWTVDTPEQIQNL